MQDPPAALVRPDGQVAWAGDAQDELNEQLMSWFGARAKGARCNRRKGEHNAVHGQRLRRLPERPGAGGLGPLPHGILWLRHRHAG
ncbi:aromatic-ring hydroxylase C-terminal domain-containing protein [Arthrobacter sp. ATA002]|uniref:aromatic-ring hydroxylase C-terminal domain-containing protein n=1 Tax=Arthrobacter sp. ATA002 TaxID=2991715 RepID=UPI002E37336F|nr:hypothetical protein [Arthrobacter sp. ATA002]